MSRTLPKVLVQLSLPKAYHHSTSHPAMLAQNIIKQERNSKKAPF
jgi:hypothetical protein